MRVESDRQIVATLKVILALAYNDAETYRDCIPGVYEKQAPQCYRAWSETFWRAASQLETAIDYQQGGKTEEDMRKFIEAASIAINQ